MRNLVIALPLALLVSAVPLGGEQPPTPVVQTELRVLDAGEIDRYIAALRELAKLGLDADAQVAGDASEARQRAAALEFGGEMQKALARHDFNAASFTDVHWNVVMAYLAETMSAQREEIEAAGPSRNRCSPR